ncbi:hypothetical protein D3C85_764300 [compost metagenome]
MLITPAMASEPYCAAAPSLKISILLIEEAGMAFKSVPVFPLPLVPKRLIREDWCLLFPLIKTRVWSGPKPLNEAGSTWSAPSEPDCLFALNEGATYCNSSFISSFPLCVVTSFTLIISIGTAEFTTVLLVFLEPTICTSCNTCSPSEDNSTSILDSVAALDTDL